MKKSCCLVLVVVLVFLLVSILSNAGAEQYGEGRALLQERCTSCHNLNRVQRKIGEYNAEAWDEYVARMQKKGARVTDSEKDVIVKFLSALESGKDL
ncbi:MAG TPA: hypothetical protein ENN79_05940 [Desulfobacteraceae bacterium]|nr:hypothetical protein [Desulfobacteraceae bacterium]